MAKAINAKLTISSLAGMREELLRSDIGAVISVGTKLDVPTHHPICYIGLDEDHFKFVHNDLVVATSLAADIWDEGRRVVFHCEKGRMRSPTAAALVLANYCADENFVDVEEAIKQNASPYTTYADFIIEDYAINVPNEAMAVWLTDSFLTGSKQGRVLFKRFYNQEKQTWIEAGRSPAMFDYAWTNRLSPIEDPALQERVTARRAKLEPKYGPVF